MRGISYNIADNEIIINLSKEFFERKAFFAAAHKLTDKYTIYFEPKDELSVNIFIRSKNHSDNESSLEEAVGHFCNEVLDQQLRLDIEKDYGNIRNMIVKQAFAPVSISELKKELINHES